MCRRHLIPRQEKIEGLSTQQASSNMAQNLFVQLKYQIYAAWKFRLAARKSDWELNDYPVVIREHTSDPEYIGTRYKQHRYSATVVNWWTLSGSGDTKKRSFGGFEQMVHNSKARESKIGEDASSTWH